MKKPSSGTKLNQAVSSRLIDNVAPDGTEEELSTVNNIHPYIGKLKIQICFQGTLTPKLATFDDKSN